MKNHESGSVILRSLPQVKSQNRRRGNAIPAWHGPLFFQLPAMGIAQLFHNRRLSSSLDCTGVHSSAP